VNKRETVAASTAVCAGLIGIGHFIDRRHGRKPIATGGAVGFAAAYVVGTYLQNVRLFGAIARPSVAAADREFSLTFDDGPDPRFTPAISRLLAERGNCGTFFVLGCSARRHPEVLRQLALDGHEIACHGDDHRLLAFALPRTIVAQLVAWERAVEAALGRPGARLVRPPHGVRSPWFVSVARRRGYAVCGWDGSVFDTAEPGTATIVHRVASLLRPGAIVLLHDGDGSGRGRSRKQTVDALGGVLDAADRKGLRSVTLGSLLGQPTRETSSVARRGSPFDASMSRTRSQTRWM
jgi:peptidoglycan/xylan/chitin deacetylase (PgdA/CDA1 family)